VKIFYISRRLDFKKFKIFCRKNQICYHGYFLTDFCLSFRNCGCTLTKIVFEFLCLEDVAVTSLVNGTVWKYTGQGFCFGMSKKKKESSAGYLDARPLPLEMFPIGRSVKEHMQRVVKPLVTMS
jgi:hypothetical protein